VPHWPHARLQIHSLRGYHFGWQRVGLHDPKGSAESSRQAQTIFGNSLRKPRSLIHNPKDQTLAEVSGCHRTSLIKGKNVSDGRARTGEGAPLYTISFPAILCSTTNNKPDIAPTTTPATIVSIGDSLAILATKEAKAPTIDARIIAFFVRVFTQQPSREPYNLTPPASPAGFAIPSAPQPAEPPKAAMTAKGPALNQP
jgi:hypothetical protein